MAADFHMDCILTHEPAKYKTFSMSAYSPETFIQRWQSKAQMNTDAVPFLDLKAQLPLIYNEIDEKITDIISNTGFILGKYVEEFEGRFCEVQDVKHCIGVSSGTDALHIALQALDIGPGDSVLVPVNTFIATAEAVSLTGAKPVFVDCDRYFNIDTQAVETLLAQQKKAGKPLPKAMIPVHLYGQPADMNRIMEISGVFGVQVVEDCCQAHLAVLDGCKTGNFGKFGAFSFYPGKNLGAYGEAGCLVTNDSCLFEKARMIRQQGEIERYRHSMIGHNYRMEAIQGAVLATKLKHLAQWTRKRRENARLYTELLTDVGGVQPPDQLGGTECAYHLYVVQTDRRDELQAYLEQHNIGTGLHYPVPLHLQAAYAHLGYQKGDFPLAEKAAGRILSLPMYPELTERQIHHVCAKIKTFFT